MSSVQLKLRWPPAQHDTAMSCTGTAAVKALVAGMSVSCILPCAAPSCLLLLLPMLQGMLGVQPVRVAKGACGGMEGG